jgi:hypothetical protein
MKVRHDISQDCYCIHVRHSRHINTCTARQARTAERKRHATYYGRTKACRSCDELQSTHGQTAKTAAYWAPGIGTTATETAASTMDERTNDGRGHNADGLHRSSDCDGQKRLASRAQPQGFKTCIVQCSAAQRSVQGSLAVNMFGAPPAARAVS